jgi:predicted acetyltransferase
VTLLPRDDAFPIIKQLYIRYATPRTLLLHRAPEMWEATSLRPREEGQPLYIAVYRDAAGEPQGYLVYQTFDQPGEAPGPEQLLEVKDFVYLTLEAYQGLWEYIRRHDLVGQVSMRGCVAEDDPAPDLLLEPRMLNRWTGDGVWMRLVDVEHALAQRPIRAAGQLTLSIPTDDMCPWNAGTFVVESDGQSVDVQRKDRPADIVLPAASLASLISGFHSATHLAHVGQLEATGPEALETADRLFRTSFRPHCANDF